MVVFLASVMKLFRKNNTNIFCLAENMARAKRLLKTSNVSSVTDSPDIEVHQLCNHYYNGEIVNVKLNESVTIKERPSLWNHNIGTNGRFCVKYPYQAQVTKIDIEQSVMNKDSYIISIKCTRGFGWYLI